MKVIETCIILATLSLVHKSVSPPAGKSELKQKDFWSDLQVMILAKWKTMMEADTNESKDLLAVSAIIEETTFELGKESCEDAMWTGYFIVQSNTSRDNIEKPFFGIGFFIKGVPDLDPGRKAAEIWDAFSFTQKSPPRDDKAKVKAEWETEGDENSRNILGVNTANKTRIESAANSNVKQRHKKGSLASLAGKPVGEACLTVVQTACQIILGI